MNRDALYRRTMRRVVLVGVSVDANGDVSAGSAMFGDCVSWLV